MDAMPEARSDALAASAPRVGMSSWPKVCIVGPLPPPSGGMANQCEQLQRLLRAEGAQVSLVRTNAPYRPAWIGQVPMLRAVFRLLPYLVMLWRGIGTAQVVHVFANSGWAWHLFAAPALVVARLRGVPAIVNYRGGQAGEFFASASRHVLRALGAAAQRVTPSPFLVRVFAEQGLTAEVIPNIIDLSRFKPRTLGDFGDAPYLVVARNLEPIYDIPTALRAFAIVREHYPRARLTVAGSGPERERLQALALHLCLGDAVHFTGRVEHADMPALYADADCALNPSTVDNMPNSVLEAFASGVPVVSTDVGGVPDIVAHGVSGLLVPAGDAPGMAREVLQVLGDRALAQRLVGGGLAQVQGYAWPQVRQQWLAAYRRVARDRGPR
jgi:glycosyltransferase involved in cell wall biosynthesis